MNTVIDNLRRAPRTVAIQCSNGVVFVNAYALQISRFADLQPDAFAKYNRQAAALLLDHMQFGAALETSDDTNGVDLMITMFEISHDCGLKLEPELTQVLLNFTTTYMSAYVLECIHNHKLHALHKHASTFADYVKFNMSTVLSCACNDSTRAAQSVLRRNVQRGKKYKHCCTHCEQRTFLVQRRQMDWSKVSEKTVKFVVTHQFYELQCSCKETANKLRRIDA